MMTHETPFRLLPHLFERESGPLTRIALVETLLHPERKTTRLCDRGRGFTGAIDRRGVDCCDLRKLGEALGQGVRLPPSLVREVQPRRAPPPGGGGPPPPPPPPPPGRPPPAATSSSSTRPSGCASTTPTFCSRC